MQLTESGQAVVRFARQLEILTTDLADECSPRIPPGPPDARHQQRLAARMGTDRLAAVAGAVQLEILREDKDYSLELLPAAAAAALAAAAGPAAGCTSLSASRHALLSVCAPDFAADLVRQQQSSTAGAVRQQARRSDGRSRQREALTRRAHHRRL